MAADQYYDSTSGDPNQTNTSNGEQPVDWWNQNAPPPSPPGGVFRGPGVYENPDGSYVGQNGKSYDAQGNEIWTTAQRTMGPATTQGPGAGTAGPSPIDYGGPQTSWGGPVAPYSGSPYPGFTPPPLPDSLKNPWTLPTAADVQNTPGYQNRYMQGLDARQKAAASRGTILNGGTLKALDRYGTDYAQQAYSDDVNQSLQQRQQASNDYLNLAYGPAWQSNQAAVNQYGTMYKNYQDNIANNRNSQNDYWSQQTDLLNAGLRAASAGSPGSTGGQG